MSPIKSPGIFGNKNKFLRGSNTIVLYFRIFKVIEPNFASLKYYSPLAQNLLLIETAEPGDHTVPKIK